MGEWLLLALLVAHYCVRTLPVAWRTMHNDFLDYYLTANLVHEHFDTSRVYEWIWLERQNDHRAIGPGINQQVVNLTPSTAFSTLALYPFAGMSALTAKRCWLVCNFGLLVATIFLLRGLTQLPVRRIALLAALSFPLRMNFAAGQYYVLLLFMLTLACYLYLRQRRFLAGVAIGISSGMKIFPVLYLLYFLRKRDWKAVTGGVVGGLSVVVVSVLVFGREMNRTYLFQILPSALRGEALDSYALKVASLSSLLHRLFIYEPQLNPHPAINAAWLFAVLQPVLQWLVLAPALLLAVPGEISQRRTRLEWSAILLASLAISTSPQSYLFTLLILPACLIFEALESKRAYRSIALMVLLYLAAGYLSGSDHALDGWRALLGVPRLYVMLLACVLLSMLLIRRYQAENSKRDRNAWAIALGLIVLAGMVGNLHHQRGLYDDYQWRISTPREAYMAIHPAAQGNAIAFIAMLGDGYHVGLESGGITQFSSIGDGEQLAVTSARGKLWTEQAGKESTVLSQTATEKAIPGAESPVASFDGRWLAYLREDHGRARMWIHALEKKGQTRSGDQPVTPPDLNVLEMSFLPAGDIVFAATSVGRPSLFVLNRSGTVTGGIQPFGAEGSRYPAVSPDGHWLAYSQLQGGNWNLWLRDMNGSTTQRITHAACNATEPAWEADSKTLLYASDCGRALRFSALCRRQVIP
jgi:hypothetical protein